MRLLVVSLYTVSIQNRKIDPLRMGAASNPFLKSYTRIRKSIILDSIQMI